MKPRSSQRDTRALGAGGMFGRDRPRQQSLGIVGGAVIERDVKRAVVCHPHGPPFQLHGDPVTCERLRQNAASVALFARDQAIVRRDDGDGAPEPRRALAELQTM